MTEKKPTPESPDPGRDSEEPTSNMEQNGISSQTPSVDDITPLLQDIAGLETRVMDMESMVKHHSQIRDSLQNDNRQLQADLDFEKRMRLSLADIFQKTTMVTRFCQEITTLDMEEIIHKAVNKIPHIIGVRYVAFYSYNNATQSLNLKSHTFDLALHDHLDLKQSRFAAIQGAIRENKCTLIKHDKSYAAIMDLILNQKEPWSDEGKSMMIVPLGSREGCVGMMLLADKLDLDMFDDKVDLPLTEQMAVILGSAIRNYQLYQSMHNQARTDGLTQLRNHAMFYEELTQEVGRANRYDLPLSLLVIDLDNFKGVNDSYGHSFGDEVLRGTATILTDATRTVDVICRYGGDEFTVLLPQTDLDGAQLIAERIVEAMSAAEFHIKGQSVQQSCSIGLAVLQLGQTPEEFFASADNALYKAKAAGKQNVQTAIAKKISSLPRPT